MKQHIKRINLIWMVIIVQMVAHGSTFGQMQKLKLSDNKRFLVKEDGSPFVWIGETNWFFAKLNPSVIDRILKTRSAQGYTIMSVSCRENLYNGKGPGAINSPNEDWWNYLDEYLKKCEQNNLYVALTLGWWRTAMNNSKEDLYNFGKWVGNRYKDNNNIVWLTLGEAGSHQRKKEIPYDKLEALVNGIRDGDSGNKLLSIHADFKRGTSISKHGELCDFNNWQTSQWCCLNDLPRKDSRKWTVWEAIQYDYQKLYDGNPKPTIDAEAWYENNKDFCDAQPFNIRRRAYFTIFAGAFGHTYGAGGIWDGLESKEKCSENALKALRYQGAEHIGYVGQFLSSLEDNFLKFIPDQSIISEGNSADYDYHIQSVVTNDRSFSLIYSASDQPYEVSLNRLAKSSRFFIWYNPRSNEILDNKKKINGREKFKTFDPPGNQGAGNDWILLIGNKQFLSEFGSNIAG